MAAGAVHGIANAGYRAIESLRLEKGYRAWGSDLTPSRTPLEAGLGFAVKLDSDISFLGREALLAQRERGLERRLVTFTVDDPDAVLFGRETVFRDGEPVGWLTSGGYGHTVEQSIALAYLPTAQAAPGTELTIGILGDRRPARVVNAPLYDPKNERLLA